MKESKIIRLKGLCLHTLSKDRKAEKKDEI